jgi:hypothetical protein
MYLFKCLDFDVDLKLNTQVILININTIDFYFYFHPAKGIKQHQTNEQRLILLRCQ